MMEADAARSAVDGKRAFHKAWDEDGLSDLAAGFFLAIHGVLTLEEQRLLRSLFGFAFVLGGRWLIGKAKSPISDRRTGYVRPRPRGDDWDYGAACTFAYLSFLIFAAARGWPFDAILLAVVATLPLLVWFPTFSRRYLGLALVSLAAAGIAWRFRGGEGQIGLSALLFGAAMLVSGALTLRAYLRRHPVLPSAALSQTY